MTARAWHHGLVARLVGISLGLSLLTLAGVATAAYRTARKALLTSEFARLETVTAAKEVELARWVAAQRAQVELLGALPGLRAAADTIARAPDPAAARRSAPYERAAYVLHAAVRIQRDLRELFVLAPPGGRVVLSTDPAREGEYRVSDTYYTRGLDSTVVQPVYASPVTGQSALTVATPLREPSGRTVAVLAAHLDLRRLDAILNERTGLGTSGESYLVDPENQFVSGTQIGSQAYRRGAHSAGIARALAGGSHQALGTSFRGVPVIGVYHWLPEQRLVLVTEMRQDEAFAPAAKVASRIVLLGVGAAALLGLLVWLVMRRIVRPIGALTEAAAGVARGDLARAVPVAGLGEVGVLADAFNDMTRQLRVAYGELEAQVEETRRAADALRDSQQLLQAILAHSAAVVTVKDLDGRYLLANDAFRRVVGRPAEAIVGRTDAELFPAEVAAAFGAADAAVRASAAPHTAELRLPDDRVFLATGFRLRDALGQSYATCCIATDITEREHAEAHRRDLESQVQHAQRLDALGRLAGGIAHDFNNLLTAIRGNAELALDVLDPGSQPHADVTEIKQVADRAASLTRQLLAFSRKQVLQPRVVDVHRVIADVEQLLRRVLGENIRLVTARDERPGCVLADPGQLEQVIVNLAVNARDAMPDGGTLRIRATRTTVDALPATSVRPALVLGDVMLVSVSDTGTGMDAATRDRAFEPFFTTKREGKGTGLGLATAHGIVDQSGGAIWIESVPGGGTTVYVALPTVDAPPEQLPAPADSAPRAGARATILLAEDEESVRTLAKRILRHAGYEVLPTADGRQAHDRWLAERAAGRPVDLLLSDVVMPVLGGRELVRRVREDDPEVPVVLMSGYVEGGVAASDLDAGTLFLEKPFTTATLLERVADALGRHARA